MCKRSLYLLDTNPLLNFSIENIFSVCHLSINFVYGVPQELQVLNPGPFSSFAEEVFPLF